MLHEVVIPFTFDTSPIEGMIAKVGEERIRQAIDEMVRKGVKDCLPKKYTYGRKTDDVDWSLAVKDCINEWLNEHTQEIIDEAVILLAAKGRNNKRWREVLDEIREEEE